MKMDAMKKRMAATKDTSTHHSMIPTAIWWWLQSRQEPEEPQEAPDQIRQAWSRTQPTNTGPGIIPKKHEACARIKCQHVLNHSHTFINGHRKHNSYRKFRIQTCADLEKEPFLPNNRIKTHCIPSANGFSCSSTHL